MTGTGRVAHPPHRSARQARYLAIRVLSPCAPRPSWPCAATRSSAARSAGASGHDRPPSGGESRRRTAAGAVKRESRVRHRNSSTSTIGASPRSPSMTFPIPVVLRALQVNGDTGARHRFIPARRKKTASQALDRKRSREKRARPSLPPPPAEGTPKGASAPRPCPHAPRALPLFTVTHPYFPFFTPREPRHQSFPLHCETGCELRDFLTRRTLPDFLGDKEPLPPPPHAAPSAS